MLNAKDRISRVVSLEKKVVEKSHHNLLESDGKRKTGK
jgi:hypothetical protein